MANRKLTDEEVRQIGLRMKAIRTLSGLTQESFSDENCIPIMSMKYWEMGRAIPRKEGIQSYIDASKKFGVEVTASWILYGSGAGPTYISGTQIEKSRNQTSYLDAQIDLFKKDLLSRGLNPVIAKVVDNEMLPFFQLGDILGGFYFPSEKIFNENIYDTAKNPWLVSIQDEIFLPRFLLLDENKQRIFCKSNSDPLIKEYSIHLVGKICWHYSFPEQT